MAEALCAENPEADKAFEALREAYGLHSRGSTVTWTEIETTMGGYRRATEGFCHWAVVERFCKWLFRGHDIVTDKRPHVGGIHYMTSAEITRERTIMRGRKARRQLNRNLKELGCVNQGELTTRERVLLSSQRHSLKQNRLATGRMYRAVENELKGTEGMPKRPEK